MNPAVNPAGIRGGISFNEDGSLKSWELAGLGIQHLPDSFGELRFSRSVNLSSNSIERLPESFCRVQIGGMLNLGSNLLTDLPPNFGEITADPIYLAWNPITAGDTAREIKDLFEENCFGDLCEGLNVILY